MLAKRTTSEDPFDQAGSPLGFGLKSFCMIGLNLSRLFHPSTHLEPIIGEADLAARVALGFDDISFDGQQQILNFNARLHRRRNFLRAGSSV